jgi:hypothetical protein
MCRAATNCNEIYWIVGSADVFDVLIYCYWCDCCVIILVVYIF